MDIRFVAQDFEWSESMKDCVYSKIIEPLQRHLKSSDFELSVHFDARKPRREMWVVLQRFNGMGNIVVRRQGGEFFALVNDVSSGMRDQLKSKKKTPFRAKLPIRSKFLSFEHTA